METNWKEEALKKLEKIKGYLESGHLPPDPHTYLYMDVDENLQSIIDYWEY